MTIETVKAALANRARKHNLPCEERLAVLLDLCAKACREVDEAHNAANQQANGADCDCDLCVDAAGIRLPLEVFHSMIYGHQFAFGQRLNHLCAKVEKGHRESPEPGGPGRCQSDRG